MIRETYKGRQLKAVKGKSFGKSRISVNGTECGEWLGTQADVIEWAKRTIDDVDSRPFEGRWNECWYEPGTYELNEIGHVTAPGGACSCDLCKSEPWNSCQNITAGGVCVCDHCMKPHRAEKPAGETEVAAEPKGEESGAEAREDAALALVGQTILVTRDLTVAGQRQRYKLLVEKAVVVDSASGKVLLYGKKLRLDGTPVKRQRKTKIELLDAGWEKTLGLTA